MKTRADFQPEPLDWLIEDWFPLGHRGMDTAPEGSFKTILGCWLSVCIASGTPVFGHEVAQGPVLIVDEETPQSSLDNHLVRFASGLGYKFEDLPIHRNVMKGFRFGRKTEMDNLVKDIKKIQPVFIRMDSMISMLPSGRQSYSENDCHLGEVIRDDLITILKSNPVKCAILLAAHSKKFIGGLSLEELKTYDMTRIVRGHGSIVGEGSDTGYVLKRISVYPEPTRFIILTGVRRTAIPASIKPMLVELEEERYGKGWARLVEISQSKLPPSYSAKSLYPLFLEKDKSGEYVTYKEDKILRTCAFKGKKECLEGIIELLKQKVVVPGGFVRSYTINPLCSVEVNKEYLEHLKNSHKEVFV